jgi:hypothetical protein
LAGLALATAAGRNALAEWRRGGWSAINLTAVGWSLVPFLLLTMIRPIVALINGIIAPLVKPSLRRAQSIAIGDDGLSVRMRLIAVDLRWNALTAVVETRPFFLFYLSRTNAIYLPKRSLAQEGDIVLVRELVRAKIGSKATLAE